MPALSQYASQVCPGLDQLRIHVKRILVHIHEHGGCPEQLYHFSGGHECEWRSDNRITRSLAAGDMTLWSIPKDVWEGPGMQKYIKSPGTDLRFSIKGLGAVMCRGDRNIPDGEVFSCPVKESVNEA